MAGFLAAHGYAPGPTQRPFLAGSLAGLAATLPATALLHLFGALEVEARILDLPVIATIAAGWLAMAVAGALYARLYGRAANDPRTGWLAGMAFGFALWAAGAVMVLPLVSGGRAPAGSAAIGVFLSLVLWGGVLGLLLPFIQRRVRTSLDRAAQGAEHGPGAAADKGAAKGPRP
jgi:hypothetical protein